MSSPAPNERIVNKNLESSNMRGHRNNVSLATAVATTAEAVTPQRAMQSVQDAFIGIIVAEKDESSKSYFMELIMWKMSVYA